MRQQAHSAIVPPRSIIRPTRIPPSIQHPADAKRSAQRRSGARILEAGDQERAQEVGVVLVEVLVPALRGVEGVHGFARGRGRGLDLLVRCVLVGVRDLGRFAEAAYAHAEPGADEEGRYCGEEDVAGGGLGRGGGDRGCRVRRGSD